MQRTSRTCGVFSFSVRHFGSVRPHAPRSGSLCAPHARTLGAERAVVDGASAAAIERVANTIGEPGAGILAVDDAVHGWPPRALPHAGCAPLTHQSDELGARAR